VLARRNGQNLESEYIAAVEPYGRQSHITAVERISGGVKITHRDGTEDRIRSTPGHFAFERVRQGKTLARTVLGEKSVRGAVTAAEGKVITAGQALSAGLQGAVILFSNPLYSRNTAYRIAAVKGNRIELEEDTVLGFGKVESLPDGESIASMVPHEYFNSVRGVGRGTFFQGKRIRSGSGASTRIRTVDYGRPMVLKVEGSAGFRPGERFQYQDVQAGDQFEILQ
jgi:hypothetical protein